MVKPGLHNYGFTPITISQVGFTPSQITTASISFGVPLPESESEFPSYPHYPHSVWLREMLPEDVCGRSKRRRRRAVLLKLRTHHSVGNRISAPIQFNRSTIPIRHVTLDFIDIDVSFHWVSNKGGIGLGNQSDSIQFPWKSPNEPTSPSGCM